MTQRKCIGLLAAGCLICIAGLLVQFFTQITEPDSVMSALLNTKYVPDIRQIVISDFAGQKSVTLEYVSGDCWTGTDGEIVFPADAAMIQNFITAAAGMRTLRIVSQAQDTRTMFGLDGNSAVQIQFYTTDAVCCSDLYFGNSNYSGKRLYVMTPDSPVYETENDLFPWLDAGAKHWAEMTLISGSFLGITDASQIQRIVAVTGGHSAIYMPGTEVFSETSELFLSLRGGALLPPGVVPAGMEPVATITVDTGDGGTAGLYFYDTGGDADRNSGIYVVTETKPGAAVPAPVQDASGNLRYVFEISRWTWDRITRQLAGQTGDTTAVIG